jgi:hypothetical protein
MERDYPLRAFPGVTVSHPEGEVGMESTRFPEGLRRAERGADLLSEHEACPRGFAEMGTERRRPRIFGHGREEPVPCREDREHRRRRGRSDDVAPLNEGGIPKGDIGGKGPGARDIGRTGIEHEAFRLDAVEAPGGKNSPPPRQGSRGP